MTANYWEGKKVAVLGWAVDSQDAAEWLARQGAKICVYDKLAEVDKKGFEDFEWRLGWERFEGLKSFDVIVRSPGVYRFRKEIVEAEKAGVEITSKTKIFFDLCPAKIIGVTGTKGKGTTTTLIYEILKRAGKKVFIGGNIGKGIFKFFDELDGDSWVVLELSSFQLIDLHKSPHVGVILMTTSDHMDWHKDVSEYVEAKANLIRFQLSEDFAVINRDYENSRKIGEVGMGKKVWVSKSDWDGPIHLRGEHNRENMAAAAAVARILDIDQGIVKKVAEEFKGLEHRLEEVGVVDRVTFFDDSISTLPETTIAALDAFSEPTVLIAGGSEKGSDFSKLGEKIAGAKNIRGVILIGLMARRVEEAIAKAGGKVKLVKGLANMHEIVGAVRDLAKPGDVVLLSPGAASFDMFKNYKDRGEQFKKEVKLACG